MNDFDLRKYMSNNSLHQSNIGGFSITELQQINLDNLTEADIAYGYSIIKELNLNSEVELLDEGLKDFIKGVKSKLKGLKPTEQLLSVLFAKIKKSLPSGVNFKKFITDLSKWAQENKGKITDKTLKKYLDTKELNEITLGEKASQIGAGFLLTLKTAAIIASMLVPNQAQAATDKVSDNLNQIEVAAEETGENLDSVNSIEFGDAAKLLNVNDDIEDEVSDLVNDFEKYLASDVDDNGFEFWMDNGIGDVDDTDIQKIIDQAIESLKSKFPNLKKITLTDNATWTNTQGDDASDDKALDGGSVSKDRQDTANKINKLLKKAIEDNFEGADVTHVEKDAVKDTSKEYEAGSLDAKKQQKVGSTWSDIESGDDTDVAPDDTGDDDADVDEGDLIFPPTDKIWFANKRPESVKTKYEVVFMQMLPSLIGGGEPEFYKNDEFKEILKYVGTIKGEKQSFSEKFIKDRIDPNGVLQQALKDPKYKDVKDKIQNTINALDWVKFSTKNPSTLGNLFKKLDPNIKLGDRKANKALPGKAGQAAKQPGTKATPSGKSFDTNLRETILSEIKSILFEKYDIQNLSTFNKEAATDNLGLLVPLYSDTWGLASNDGVTGIEYDVEYLGNKYKNSLNKLKTIFPKVKTVVSKSVKLKDKETTQPTKPGDTTKPSDPKQTTDPTQPKVKKEKEHAKSSRLAAIEKEIESKKSIQTILKLVDQTQEIDPFIFGLLALISNKFENDKNKLRLIIQGTLSKFNKQSTELAKSSKKKTKGGTKVGGFNYAEKADIKEDIKKPNTQVIKALDTLKKNPIIGPRLDQLVTTDEAINLITDIFFDLDDPELKIFPNASPAEIKQGLERALKLFQSDKEIQSSFNNKTADDQSKGLDVFYKGYTSTSSDYKVKESLIKKYIKEALTPDEAAKVEPKYKETYAAMIKGKGPLKLKKYDNPDKVVRGRVVNTIKNESLKIAEKLGKTADVGDYKDDFRKSDAPQFKGKSKKKRDQMDTAAFLNKEEQKLDEIDNLMNETGQEIAKKNMDMYKDKNRLNELVKAALMGPINETLDDKVYDLVDRMLGDMGGSDNLLEELIRAMSTKDAMFYLSAIARDYGMFNDAEELEEKQASTDKYDNDPALKGKQSDLPDALQKGILGLEEDNIDEAEVNEIKMMDFAKEIKAASSPENFLKAIKKLFPSENLRPGDDFIKNMFTQLKPELSESFDSLSKDIDKQKGKTKEDGDNIAGYIANIKRKGGGKGPTAKQKKRMAEYIFKELRK